MTYPKLLIVSRLNWDDNSNSNTLSNFFDGYDTDKIARIYIETKQPNTKCCHHFYQISEVALIHRLFKWKTKTGRVLDTQEGYTSQVNQEVKEESLMAFARHHRSILLTICRDILWNFGGWKTPELKQFILDFNPDVVWLDGSPLILMNKLNNYVAEIAGKPTCTFLMDDAYTYKSCTSLSSRIYRFFIRKHIRKTIVNSRHVFVSSEKMKHEFDNIFSINSTFLAKGVTEFKDCAQLPLATPPFKIVYLGNVLIGRFDSLILLAEAIHRINTEQGKKYELSVYTGDYIPEAKKKKFLLDDSIRLCKPVPYNEVPNIINANDMVVFVESLEGKQPRIARLSFSTKIVDYIVSGKCILTIGPADISPVEYLKEHGISIAACSKDEIYSVLDARKNHDKKKIQANLYNIIKQLANKNKVEK